MLRPILEDGVSQTQVAQTHKLPLRTLQRWLKQYRRCGLAGLAHQARADRGKRRGMPTELIQLIEGLALQKPAPSVAAIYCRVKEVCAKEGWKPPSYSRVYQIIQQLDPALVTLAQDGPKIYRETFDLLYRREASHSNAMWQADHTLLDIWLVGEQAQSVKAWLTIILDDYSRAIAGYRLSFQAPSALQTALTLRQAIWRKEESRWHICGIPSTFYTDHGSDFTSKHLEQVAADLKMELIFSLPGQPRGRGKIERFFGTVNQNFLAALPGYAPAGSSGITPSLTLPTLEKLFHEWLMGNYHQRVQLETGSAPQARWEAGGFLPRLPESVEQLDLLLLTVAKSRRVQQDGIHFQGLRYLDLNLAAYVGEDVTIRYDPRDLAEIKVFYKDGFLCRAVCPELAAQTIGLKEIVAARNQRRQELRQGLKEREGLVERFLAVPQPEATLPMVSEPVATSPAPRLKRYENE